MSHSQLIDVLRRCPYSNLFCYPQRLLSLSTHNRFRALTLVQQMIAAQQKDSSLTNRPKEIQERGEQSEAGSHILAEKVVDERKDKEEED